MPAPIPRSPRNGRTNAQASGAAEAGKIPAKQSVKADHAEALPNSPLARLRLLVALDALLRHGSVSEAGRELGLSTPAMSHALARIRERFEDPILVRSGRGMRLTPRAEELKSQVHEVVEGARRALAPKRPFVARELSRSFVVHASDYVLTILGSTFDRLLREEAPLASVRFVPNTVDDPALLRDEASDLAVGIYGELPQEMRSRPLLTDRFVAVVRRDGRKLEVVARFPPRPEAGR